MTFIDYKKESVELTSVYLIEGCGKTRSKIRRHNTPHSNRYGISGHRMCPSTSIYTKVSVVPFRPFDQENFHIFNQGLAKNTFTICNVRWRQPNDATNVAKLFQTDNTHKGYCKIGIKILFEYLNDLLQISYGRLRRIPHR